MRIKSTYPTSPNKLHFQGLTISIDNNYTTMDNTYKVDVTPTDNMFIIKSKPETYVEISPPSSGEQQVRRLWRPIFSSPDDAWKKMTFKPFTDIYQELAKAIFKYNNIYRKVSYEYFIKGQQSTLDAFKTRHVTPQAKINLIKEALRDQQNQQSTYLNKQKSELLNPILAKLANETASLFKNLTITELSKTEQNGVLTTVQKAKDVSFNPSNHGFRLQNKNDNVVPTPIISNSLETQKPTG